MNAIDLHYKKMTETPVSKLIITLGIPTTISMLITSIYNLADTYFVGTLGEIKGTFDDSRYVVRKMSPATSALGYVETVYDLNVQGDMIGAAGGHGGGDRGIVHAFCNYT